MTTEYMPRAPRRFKRPALEIGTISEIEPGKYIGKLGRLSITALLDRTASKPGRAVLQIVSSGVAVSR